MEPQKKSKKKLALPKTGKTAAAELAAESGTPPQSPQLHRNNAGVGDGVGPSGARRHLPSPYGERRIHRHRPLVSLASHADIGGAEFSAAPSLGPSLGLEPCYSIALGASPETSLEPGSTTEMFVNPVRSPRTHPIPDTLELENYIPDREDNMEGNNSDSAYGSSPRYIMTPKNGFDLQNAFSLHNAESTDSIDDIFGTNSRRNKDGAQEFWLKFLYGLLAGMIVNFLAIFPVFWMERTEKRRTAYLIGLSIGSLLQVALIGSWIVFRSK